MGIFQRAHDIVQAKTNKALDAAETHLMSRTLLAVHHGRARIAVAAAMRELNVGLSIR